jgi:hypothetical protein
MLLTEVLSAVMGFAVFVMGVSQVRLSTFSLSSFSPAHVLPLSSQLNLVLNNRTSVETLDHDWYRKLAASRGRTFLNPYDLGRRENLKEFFNVGEGL